MVKKPNIAIFSPTQRTYSETFIQVHKENITGNIFYYYGPLSAIHIEGKGNIFLSGNNWKLKLFRRIFFKSYTWYFEHVLRKSLRKNNIDTVLCEYGDYANNFVNIFQKIDLPFIVHFHGYDASIREVVQRNNRYTELFANAKFIVSVSWKMYNDLLEMGCPKNKLIYNVYGPREEFFEVVPHYSKPQFVSIGRFTHKKAPYYLILAFKEVSKKFPGSHLIMAGEGELLDLCKNLVNYFGLKENISFPGVISGEQYRKFLGESLAMVQHSITPENGDSEGTPLAILEASAAGLPVISTLHAGIPDIIIQGETGFLVEEHEVKQMANHMLQLLKNPDLAKEIGWAGKQNIKKNFSVDQHIKKLNELFRL